MWTYLILKLQFQLDDEHLETLPYPILRRMSSPRVSALRCSTPLPRGAPAGAAAPHAARLPPRRGRSAGGWRWGGHCRGEAQKYRLFFLSAPSSKQRDTTITTTLCLRILWVIRSLFPY